MNRSMMVMTVAAALGLGSCGLIQTPDVAIPDATVDLPPSASVVGKIVYLNRDLLGGTSIPGILQQVSITGNATYLTSGGSLKSASVYIRSTLDNLPSTCVQSNLAPVFVCDPSGETGRQIGTMTLTAGVATPFTLSGSALDEAAKAGRGYIGVLVTQGSSVASDQLKLTDLKAKARL